MDDTGDADHRAFHKFDIADAALYIIDIACPCRWRGDIEYAYAFAGIEKRSDQMRAEKSRTASDENLRRRHVKRLWHFDGGIKSTR